MSLKRSTTKIKICPGCKAEMPRNKFVRHLSTCEPGRQKLDARHQTYCARCGMLAAKDAECFRCSGGREDIDAILRQRNPPLTSSEWRELHGERTQ